MIKVIKESLKKRVKCDRCQAILEYSNEDTKELQMRLNEYARIIECPCCGNIIQV